MTTARNLPGIAPCALTTLTGTNISVGVNGVVKPNSLGFGPHSFSFGVLDVEIGGQRVPIVAVANESGKDSIIVQSPCNLPAPGRT